ncbi:hypothetical protein B5807_07074 [Epicoccum nigrum]|uniref:J domain-containing protein n=1 Tax=Epicoccum nigrum TaxID=105696 RepID=A0A1Y2LYB4_EPING|nr:hypothetical protein B5807_07074 [Epicoccum nigrum]
MAMWPPAEPVQRDHYYELQVHYRVTNKEIRKAYLKLSLEHHPDKLPPNASDAKFKRITDAYETLSNSNTRHVYDQQYLAIWNAWAKYGEDVQRYNEEVSLRQKREAQAQEKRRMQKAEANKRYREKKAREQAEEVARIKEERKRAQKEREARQAQQGWKEQNRQADVKAREERENQERKEAAQKQAAARIHAEQLAARRRQQREYDAEARTRLAAEQAQSQNTKAAEERLRQIQEKEANVRMRKIARLSREEAEKEESKQKQDEKEAIEQWQAAIEQAQERERVERVHLERKNAMQQKKIAEDWQRANLYRQQEQNKDVKPNINDLRNDCDQSTEDMNRRETAAAENFTQEIMRIRGDSKTEVLRDVVLMTLEAVDREIVAQKGRKRKASSLHDDPARLPALVTELFAKMEANGDASERFRFSKKRRVV